MFGRKCSLCGGRLDTHKICKECGLDNSKSEKYYKINRSSCDGEPLTHVHTETERTLQKRKTTAKPKQGKGCLAVVILVFSVLIIIPAAIGTYLGIRDSEELEWTENDYSDLEDPYEHLDFSNPETDISAEYSLVSGKYIVGIHIPVGDYVATMSNDYDSVDVTDYENDVYLFEYLGKEEGHYLDDLRLFEGAIVTITTETEVLLQTENAQELSEGIDNPLSDVWINDIDESLTAGIDFEAGVYDLFTDAKDGFVSAVIYDEFGEELEYIGFSIGSQTDGGMEYRNLVLPENAVLSVEDAVVEFTPSPVITSTEYLDYYQY